MQYIRSKQYIQSKYSKEKSESMNSIYGVVKNDFDIKNLK